MDMDEQPATTEETSSAAQGGGNAEGKLGLHPLELEEEVPSGTDVILDAVLQIASPDFRSSEDCVLSPDRLSCQLDDLLCSICQHILNQAVESPCCQQLFCAECIWTWLDTAAKCPTCRKKLFASELVPLHPRILGILANIPVACDYLSLARLGCSSKIPLHNLKLLVACYM